MKIAVMTLFLAFTFAHSAIAATEKDAAIDAAAHCAARADHGCMIEALNPFAAEPDWDTNFWLGTAYLLAGEPEVAADFLDESISAAPNRQDTWTQRGIVEHELGRPEVAAELLSIAISIDESAPLPYLNLGYALEALGRLQEATRAYRSYLRHTATGGASPAIRRQIMARLPALTAENP